MSLLIDVVEAVVGRAIFNYIRLFSRVVEAIFDIKVAEFLEAAPRSIDERLEKIEIARSALAESLSAIEDLQREAEKGKAEYARVAAELDAALRNRDEAAEKLQAIRALMAHDVGAFQALAGVPNLKRERIIAFFSGVFASLAASGAIWGGTALVKHLLG